jgi:hypothetical protein
MDLGAQIQHKESELHEKNQAPVVIGSRKDLSDYAANALASILRDQYIPCTVDRVLYFGS